MDHKNCSNLDNVNKFIQDLYNKVDNDIIVEIFYNIT